ncbi:MAG TPA: hypothetical protein VGL65_09665 [Gemmatimonadales bacterium]
MPIIPAALEHLLAAGASTCLIVGVIIALLQLRGQRHIRTAEIAMRLYASFGEDTFVRHFRRVTSWDYVTYEAFRARNDADDYVSLMVVSVFFESMGLLLKRGLAPIDLLDDLLSGPVLAAWPKVAPIWVGMRHEFAQPSWAEWFEAFYVAIARRSGQSLKSVRLDAA